MSAFHNLDDLLLVRRAVRGDTQAFERLYRAHIDRVYAVCLRLVADPQRAEELAQEAFVRAWQKLATFRGAAAFSSWLYRLTVNVVVESQRSLGRVRLQEGQLSEEPAPDDGSCDGQIRGLGESDPDVTDKVDLERAIAALPDGARTVFVLHDIEGYEHGEIATITGASVGTSKAQLHRARRLLRERLER